MSGSSNPFLLCCSAGGPARAAAHCLAAAAPRVTAPLLPRGAGGAGRAGGGAAVLRAALRTGGGGGGGGGQPGRWAWRGLWRRGHYDKDCSCSPVALGGAETYCPSVGFLLSYSEVLPANYSETNSNSARPPRPSCPRRAAAQRELALRGVRSAGRQQDPPTRFLPHVHRLCHFPVRPACCLLLPPVELSVQASPVMWQLGLPLRTAGD